MIPWLTGFTLIYSDMSLTQVAQMVSKAVFGGVDFYGEDENLCDETPCVHLRSHVLGLHGVLGYSGEPSGQYSLSVTLDTRIGLSGDQLSDERTDISDLLAFLLKDVEGIKVEKI